MPELGRVDFTAHRHPVLAVPCPDCGTRAGAWCRRPSGWKAERLHRARRQAADRVWQEGGYPPIVRDLSTSTGWAYADGHGLFALPRETPSGDGPDG